MRGPTRRAIAWAPVAVLAAACSVPAPVPEGYAFPTWHVGDGGAAALLDGELAAERGCLYVQPPRGGRYLIVWPDTWRLVIQDGTPVVVEGEQVVARSGEPVRLGGGEIGPGLIPSSAAACQQVQVWGANSIVPAG